MKDGSDHMPPDRIECDYESHTSKTTASPLSENDLSAAGEWQYSEECSERLNRASTEQAPEAQNSK